MDISKSSSVVVIGCHPDDVKSLTGVMLRGIHSGAKVSVVCVTNGERFNSDTYEEATEMGERRKKEQFAFLSSIGIAREDVFLLGFSDSGLTALRDDFRQNDGIPYFAMLLCSDHIIDKDAYRQDVPFFGEAFLGLLKEIITDLKPTHVFTHHPMDNHDDHRATAFFVKKAVSELVAEGRLEHTPETYSSLVYFPRIQWPPAGETFLSPEVKELPFVREAIQFQLTPEEQNEKREACKIFAPTLSQVLGDDYVPGYMKTDELYWKL